jgi:hypothetical protein
VVGIAAEGLRDDLVELGLNVVDGLAGCEAGAVADAEHMGVDCKRLLAPGGVKDDVGGLPADARQGLQVFAVAWHFAAEPVDERMAERDHILRLGVEQPDRLDGVSQAVLAEFQHPLRRRNVGEDRAHRRVDARVRRLGGENDGDQQGVRIAEGELGRGRGVGLS